jgi:hypothetical protein
MGADQSPAAPDEPISSELVGLIKISEAQLKPVMLPIACRVCWIRWRLNAKN